MFLSCNNHGTKKKSSVPLGNGTLDLCIPCSDALPLLSCAHENCTCASDDPAPEHIKLICAVGITVLK